MSAMRYLIFLITTMVFASHALSMDLKASANNNI